MKNNDVKTFGKLNLQFFADGGAGDPGAGDPGAGDPGAGTGAGDSGGGDGSGASGQSFADLLKNPEYQSEFDKLVAKSLETAKSKWDTDYAQKLADAKTEAEKLAKMTQDQKTEYETKKRIAELDAREKEITCKELKATARLTLTEMHLPESLAEVLDYTDADKCKASIDAVGKAFSAALETAVNDRLKGTGAPKGAGQSTAGLTNLTREAADKLSDAEYYASLKRK